jgi:hypothetical protein
MSDPTKVTIFSASDIEAAVAHGAMINAINLHLADPRAVVECVSGPLADQNRRVQVEGTWPMATPAGGGETADIINLNRRIITTTIARADLKLHRNSLKSLMGAANVVVLHWKHYPAAAQHGILARAYWLQQELGMTAGEALLESLRQIYFLDEAQLALRPKFLGRMKTKLAQGTWEINLAKDHPAERYPLAGVAARDSRPLYRDLEDLVTCECRKVAPEQRLLMDVLNESSAPLIVQFAGAEELPMCPGLSVDWLRMSQSVVAPRSNVTYLSEPLVHLRLCNDAETIDSLEGFNESAGTNLWSAVTSARLPSYRRPELVGRAKSISRKVAIAGAIVLPIVLLVALVTGVFTLALAALGTLLAVGIEWTLVARALSPATVVAKPSPAGATQASPLPECNSVTPAPDAHRQVEIPEAIAKRSKPVTNGSHV